MKRKDPLRVAFDRRLKLEFHGAKIALALAATATASTLAEADAARTFATGCSASCGRRSTACSPAEDVNDAERLVRDPAIRAIVGREGLDRPAASTSQIGRF